MRSTSSRWAAAGMAVPAAMVEACLAAAFVEAALMVVATRSSQGCQRSGARDLRRAAARARDLAAAAAAAAETAVVVEAGQVALTATVPRKAVAIAATPLMHDCTTPTAAAGRRSRAAIRHVSNPDGQGTRVGSLSWSSSRPDSRASADWRSRSPDELRPTTRRDIGMPFRQDRSST